jgi:hypothetical protein
MPEVDALQSCQRMDRQVGVELRRGDVAAMLRGFNARAAGGDVGPAREQVEPDAIGQRGLRHGQGLRLERRQLRNGMTGQGRERDDAQLRGAVERRLLSARSGQVGVCLRGHVRVVEFGVLPFIRDRHDFREGIDALLGQRKPRLVRLPAKVRVDDGPREHQRGRIAFGCRRARLAGGGFDAGAFLAPPVEGVARRQAQVIQVVPVEPEETRLEQAVVAQSLAARGGAGVNVRTHGSGRDAHRFTRGIETRLRRGQRRAVMQRGLDQLI